MNIYGGGAQTNANGLKFEQETDLRSAFIKLGLYVSPDGIVSNGMEAIGRLVGKHQLYTFLKELGVDWEKQISKKMLPDDAFFNYNSNTVYIVEKKFQKTAGSVDEKLQTCDFKQRQYEKLFNPAGIMIKYTYLLNDWFKKDCYEDVLQYIEDVNCYYFFNEIPLKFFDL